MGTDRPTENVKKDAETRRPDPANAPRFGWGKGDATVTYPEQEKDR